MNVLNSMPSSILLPLAALAALMFYKLVTFVVERQRDAAFARQHKCLPEPVVPDDGFLGLSLIKKMQAADKSRLFMNFLEERTDNMSKHVGRQVSTYSTAVMGKKGFYTCDPKNIQAILALQFEDFDLGSLRRTIMGATLGDGIFTQDGKGWEHSRAMLRPNFVRDQVSDLGMNERHVQDLFTVMPVQADGWTEFTNIQELFFRMTVDSATEFLFGESTHTQIKSASAPTSEPKGGRDERAFAQHFDSAQNFMAQKFRYSELHWLHNPKEYKTDIRIVHEFVDYYVDLALRKNGEKSADKYVFLEALAQQTRDPIALRSQLLNILLAGRDTTSSLLCWVFHELLRHPATFDKLRQTIISTFGPYDESDTSAITFTNLKSCTYLQHTLSEALRLWPVVPGNSRRSNKRTTLPRGGGPDGLSPVFIPADTQVDYSVHNMMRRPDLWGDDAATFRPERFEGRKAGWDFLPFNGGPRICIGQQFALTEASYVVVRILQRFDQIEAPPGALDGPVKQNLTLTSCPDRPVTLKARLAKA